MKGNTPSSGLTLVTFRVASRWFGVSAACVQEVIAGQRVARIPLAPPDVQGFLNLRGQIVTVLDIRQRLGLLAIKDHSRAQSSWIESGHHVDGSNVDDSNGTDLHVVVRDETELFSLRADEIGDVVDVPDHTVELFPTTLDAQWNDVCIGVVRRVHDVVVILDVGRLVCDPTIFL